VLTPENFDQIPGPPLLWAREAPTLPNPESSPPHFTAIRLEIACGQTLAENYQHKIKLFMQQWLWTKFNYTTTAQI